MKTKKKPSLFDLNVEKILDHWDVPEAIREVIANALDEAALTSTVEPEIVRRHDGWHVIDSGRGLRYQHLTQNENPEKRRRPDLVVGKFGVGLKDALATFHRRGIEVMIRSPQSDITLQRAAKSNFADVKTLHAAVAKPSEPKRKGTDFVLRGLKDADMAAAKDYFLRFAGDEELERTDLGSILRRHADEPARVYVKGVRVATEEQFLFSYNITSTTAQLQKALNRERSNVGRTAYQDRVKAILLKSKSGAVAEQLAADLTRIQAGTNHDEITWLDVQEQAVRILATQAKSIFVTSRQLLYMGAMIQEARTDGYKIQWIPDRLAARLPELRDLNGKPILDLSGFIKVWNESFTFDFVDPSKLNAAEKKSWGILPKVLRLARDHAKRVQEVRISETMRLDEAQYETEGVWDSPHIVVKRSVLDTPRHFARVLLHEIAHASSNANHGSIPFMAAIDDLAGVAAVQAISNRPSKKQPARANGRESHPRHAETRSRARKRAR
ncbi:MAG: sensor histidine kinase [Chloroflexi bacterium]|nr:MAG: sensor histidine kinase [Chloroflexota bacterium]